MKKATALIWVLLITVALHHTIFAGPGNKPFTGTITYDIRIEGNVPPEYRAMLPKTAVYQISEQFVRVDMTPSMGGGAMIMDHKNQTMRALIDYPGLKYQLVADEMLKEQAARAKNINTTTETKQIAGHLCKKAMVDAGGGNIAEVWYSEKIQVANLDKMWGNLKGFPLAFSNPLAGLPGVTMHFTATEVKSGKIDKKQFEISSDYQTITQEQLMQIMQGMGQ